MTNLTDPDEAPAGEVAALYARRWEIEIVFKALKVDLAACKPVFRSATADGVTAEIWSLLAVYQAIGIWRGSTPPVKPASTHARSASNEPATRSPAPLEPPCTSAR